MAISKLIFDGVTQMDLTADTVVANKLYSGFTAHGADGLPILGSYTPAGGLPDGYSRIPYVEATGAQHIDVGITPDATTKIELEFQFVRKNTASEYILGTNQKWCLYRTTSFTFSNGSSIGSGFGCIDKHRLTIGNLYLTLTDPWNATASITSGVGSASYTLALFANHSATSTYGSRANGRIYSFRAWQSGILVRDMVPAVNSSFVAGLYDMVNGVFYTSETSTALVAGDWANAGYAPLMSAEYTVNTSSTTAAEVATLACGSLAWSKNHILYVKVRDKAGPRSGYFLGSDVFFFNRQAANGGATTMNNAARATHNVDANGDYQFNFYGGTNGYGVYAYSIASGGGVVIQSRYNSTSSRTINGTFNVEAFLLDYVRPTGNPYNFTF